MSKNKGDRRDLAHEKAAPLEINIKEELGRDMPEDTLVVNPYGSLSNGKPFPADQRYEREEKLRFPNLFQKQFVRVRLVGAVKYFSSDNNKSVYQVSVWKQNPYQGYAEKAQRTGQLIDARRMAAQGVDHYREMKKSRWQVAWGYNVEHLSPGGGVLDTSDLGIALDKCREFIGKQGDSNQLMLDVYMNVQAEIIQFLRTPKQYRSMPPWVLEEEGDRIEVADATVLDKLDRLKKKP